MKKQRTQIVFQKGRARLYKGKQLIGTLEYEPNKLLVDVVIHGLAKQWSKLKRTLARAALAKKRKDRIRDQNAAIPPEGYMVQPRHKHFASLPILSQVNVTALT
ncbi:hypothetical protein pEaSNUABM29_00017 [Erwinia phage pEa_SNUABM_29]|nr:hypothetical protein pEaSNUABM29_00017 [Erwinia phage pEa_SNUABM_29]